MLVAAASHLGDDASLIAATHVCHLWRTTLLSSPRLWSHLDFANEKRALAFLERSKSVPLRVDLMGVEDPSETIRESLNKMTTKMTTLWAVHDSFLSELLAQPMPALEVLEITDSCDCPKKPIRHFPSLTSLVIHGSDRLRFRAPILTVFRITHDPVLGSLRLGLTANSIHAFLRSCPLLQVASLDCGDMDTHLDSNEVVSLPFLRSFTHESYCDSYQLCLLDPLSLPSSCRVVLGIDVTGCYNNPWVLDLPTPRNTSYLSDVRTIKIAARTRELDVIEEHVTFKIEFLSSAGTTITFNRSSFYDGRPSRFSYEGFLDIPENIGIGSVDTLCFDHYPVITHYTIPHVSPEHIAEGLRKFQNLKTLILVECDIIPFLDDISSCPVLDTLVIYSMDLVDPFGPTAVDVVKLVQEFAISRKEVGSPLKALTLVLPSTLLHPPELELLSIFVGLVEVVTGDDALCWDLDEYLQGAIRKDDTSRF